MFTSLEEEVIQEVDDYEVMDNLFKSSQLLLFQKDLIDGRIGELAGDKIKCCFPIFPQKEKGWSPPLFGNTMGDVNTHYLEAVR